MPMRATDPANVLSFLHRPNKRTLDVKKSTVLHYETAYISNYEVSHNAYTLSRVWVTKMRVWIGNWIYWILTGGNYNYLLHSF
jgi:hypothetical protein